MKTIVYTAGEGTVNGRPFPGPSEARQWLETSGWVERLPKQPNEFYNPHTGGFASLRNDDIDIGLGNPITIIS